MTNGTCEEGVNPLLSKVSGFSKLLHVSAVNGRVTEQGSRALKVGDHQVTFTHLMREMAERSHGWTLAQLEVIGVFGPLFDVDQRLSIEIVSSIERSIQLVNGWRKEINGSDIEVARNLSEVLGHLESVDLTDESLHGSLLILGRVSVEDFEINFNNHVLILSRVSNFEGLTCGSSSQFFGLDSQVNLSFLAVGSRLLDKILPIIQVDFTWHRK